METIKENEGKSILKQYADMMEGFTPQPFIQTEWEMKDGLYVQYSAYKEKTPVQSGIANTIMPL